MMKMSPAAKQWFLSCQVIGSMLLVQVFATGMVLLSKIILNGGTFVFALLAYRHIVAALCVAPFALALEKWSDVTIKLRSCSVWFWLFVNAVTGITLALGLYYCGLRETTATYAVNFFNLIPIITFAFSVILRMEKLALDTTAGRMKSIGAVVCVVGAAVACLYKGKTFHLVHGQTSIAGYISKAEHNHHHESRWVPGTLMLIGGCVSYSAWYILQVKVNNVFPFRYWATMLTCAIAAVQSAAVGVCVNRSRSAWRLGWDLPLVTIVYSGALSSAATFCLVFWVVGKRGPIYPPMFNALTLVFVTLLGALLLDEQLSVGALLGMVAILVGLYSFLLGKNKEMKEKKKHDPEGGDGDEEANVGVEMKTSTDVDDEEAELQSDSIVAVTSRSDRQS